MAHKEILLVSQGVSFILSSLTNRLQNDGFDVKRIEPIVSDIEENITKEHTMMVLLFAGDYLKNTPGAAAKAADKCNEQDVPLCLIGYPNEIADLEARINISSVTAEFNRPFEAPDVAGQIEEIIKGYAAPPPEDTAPLPDTMPESRHHIMLCDDDTMFLKILQEWLSDKYRLTAVKTGMMALTVAAKNKPELILLDYEMPIMSGATVLEKLREDNKTADIPVVFLTGHSDKASVLKVMSLRPQGYLLKTTGQEELLDLLENFFAEGQWKNKL